jgi:predicted flap endonuclease-1-like 5' DNA nuclease
MNIQAIEEIGPVNAERLRGAGVKTVANLLEAGASKAGRLGLSAETGLAEDLLLEWVNRADLMRVRGIGTQYSDLLEAAGVDTVKELGQRRADNLHQALREANEARHLVRRTPTPAEVGRWIARAKELAPVVSY